MRRGALLVLLVIGLSGARAFAQGPVAEDQPPPPPAQSKAMAGSWEFSNADREKICTITFKSDAAAAGQKVEFDRNCANVFPFVRDIVGWSQSGNDFLRLLDAHGQSLLEFSEVESGIFEAPKQGEGILFIQAAASVGPAPKTAQQVKGEWNVVRGAGKPICALTLTDTAVGEEFAVQVTPPCDRLVTNFAPATWQVDRGEIVLKSVRGQMWRFELGDDSTWRRVPGTANPVLLVRK
jgi:hypothetical protein